MQDEAPCSKLLGITAKANKDHSFMLDTLVLFPGAHYTSEELEF